MIASPAASVRPKPRAGSFAAGIRAMLDDARAGLDRAKADGLAKVQDAVGELQAAKEATGKISDQIAQTIRDEAADARAELGQFTNEI